MTRNKVRVPNISLTSLMDVFIVMVIYLLMNQTLGVDTPPPKAIKLPDSVVDTVPRQTAPASAMSGSTDVQNRSSPSTIGEAV